MDNLRRCDYDLILVDNCNTLKGYDRHSGKIGSDPADPFPGYVHSAGRPQFPGCVSGISDR